ncbi:MAG: hypothetical protein A2X42_08320 [Candidatus Margulisbacteria bacterium GWF2_38_17]|nr:MAG: hypothetical protein A2X43_04630 [Candidatus Margulisbacteria bacterium GWD2_39_127]OGI01570.1 MAG: hypothetical protein A2X42_08320 [Candidatus Margulisbacteria bacterium GWF2_38_17]OGI10012.1 MAG: hypothetical protein A2X41_09030 [Candidatus Margulisbacteria bacterium GWE2_39_32]
MERNYNALLVDDSRSLRMVVQRLIKSSGYSFNVFWEANDGREALKIASNNEIDIIFTDLNMPVLGGIEFIKEFRKTKKSIPIIVVTTLGSQQIVMDALKCGANDYIIKPFSHERIKSVLGKFLK